ncbi:hypothetical protein ACIBH1_45170 [Nonomuraea sp. NPDC050663]|uniref:hypothetical protein n=1 Tax=Nonomuraea sp. NPDC050663 TaxID=3364370 RepID=UPI00378886D2
MPVEVDPSLPLVATAYDALSVGPFNTPAGALLVVGFAGYGSSTPLADGVTFTLQQESPLWTYAQLWTAPLTAARTGLEIEMPAAEMVGGMKVWVVTGQASPVAVGQGGSGSLTTNNATVTGYNSSRAGTLGLAVGYEDDQVAETATPTTSTDIFDRYYKSDLHGPGVPGSALFLHKAAPATAAGQAVTFNLNAPGTAAADWHWAAIEILNAPDAPSPPRIVHAARAATHRASSW